MLLDQATSRNVSRALNEINGFDWEGDFKPMALQVLKDLVQKQLEEAFAAQKAEDVEKIKQQITSERARLDEEREAEKENIRREKRR